MGIDTEILEQLKGTVTELKQIVSSIQVEPNGSINANIQGNVSIDSISIKDATTNNQAIVDADGKLLIKNDIVQIDSFTIKDPISNIKAKVDVDGKLLVKSDLTLIDSFIIRDSNNPLLKASVDSSGRLLVATPPATPPASTTPVIITAFGTVSGNTDSVYTITNGKKLVIGRLLAGSEEATKACKVTLYDNPSGDGVTLILIA
ncbi:MAG: hypothetical protein Q8Q86_01475, partial [Candidatus Daviesbacteria bacterium]|nr:hypothetical protein [Candidatus Daviesbacteria bacterium]